MLSPITFLIFRSVVEPEGAVAVGLETASDSRWIPSSSVSCGLFPESLIFFFFEIHFLLRQVDDNVAKGPQLVSVVVV